MAMNDAGTDTAPWLRGSPRFATTQWTIVLRAGREGPDRAAALEKFCRAYWYPVYAFVRRRGAGPDEARDLVQEFFARMIEKSWLDGVEHRETRFSTLLLTMLKRFLVNEHLHAQAAKRGGGVAPVSIDLAQAEQWFGAEPATHESPDRIFERRWALSAMAAALERLREEMTAAEKRRHFEILSPFLSSEPGPRDYEKAGAELTMASRTVAVAVHRLRLRYRDLLRDELAGGSPDRARAERELKELSRSIAD
jgi:DNA-directed RNA polymerase specialized sigma24 family protein